MSVVEQVELLNNAANTALSLVPLWALLYLGLHVLQGIKPQPQPVPQATPGPLVSSLRANRVAPAPKPEPELIPEPQPTTPRKRTRKAKAQP